MGGDHDAAQRNFIQKPGSEYPGEGRWSVNDGSAPIAQLPQTHPGLSTSQDVLRMPA